MISSARLKGLLDTLCAIVVIVVGCALLWTMFLREQSPAPARAGGVVDVWDVIPAKDVGNVHGSGEIAIVEFSDFQCPFCAKHAQDVVPRLMNDFTHRVRYVAMNLPLDIHPHAVRAAEVAECAARQGHDEYWRMRSLLYERQRELATADYAAYGKEIGLDLARLDSCLAKGETLAKVQSDKALANRLGATGTPTLLIGRMRADGGIDLRKRINGAAPLETIRTEVEKLHKTKV